MDNKARERAFQDISLLNLRGKENQPALVRDVAEYMAVLKGVSLEQLAQQTTDNFATLFHIDPARLQPA